MALPSGTVTFLFTDIEGSTRLWQQHPDAMRVIMTRHDALLTAGIEQHGGVVVKSRGEGDSFFAVFVRATDAVASASTIQQALLCESWPSEISIRVRMALHTGEADLRDNDYYGNAVNRCARLRAIAHGGQVVLSLATTLVVDTMPEGVSLREMGSHRLKDLQSPEQVFQLLHPDLPSEFPPLSFLDTLPHNLPVQLTSFIGREEEIAEIDGLLANNRLVTLAGGGGSGKTRLSLEVGSANIDAFSDGVWLVQLASITDPSQVDRAVTLVIGPPDPSERLLLLIDNCEHLLDSCAQTAVRVLQQSPLGRILATSREPLGVPGEVTYRVPPLPIPPSSDIPLESISRYQSVTLFVDRARSSQPDLALTEATGPAVSQIARRLDGIPLAIELAAARVKVLSVDEIARRLDDMFRLLTGSSRGTLPHQRTLQAAIDWSYQLLTGPEQLLFNRLSVFRGGFTLEAAEQVSTDPDQRQETLELLAQLVSKSIVMVEQKEGGPTRYRLLETLRQYAWERLQESGETVERRDRHTRFFMELAKSVETKLQARLSVGLRTSLKDDQDNLRAAWEWVLESNNPEFVGSESMDSLVSIMLAL